MATTIPFYPYQLFFRYVEPVVTIVASVLAGMPSLYLSQLKYVFDAASAPSNAPKAPPHVQTEVNVSLYQLSNLYLMFAILGPLLLRSSTNTKTWKAYLACFLFADIGHVATLYPLADGGLLDAFWRIDEWNYAGWGMIGYLAFVIVLRSAFLLEVGFGRAKIGGSHDDIRSSSNIDVEAMDDSTPILYKIFFLYLEPLSALTGAIFAAIPATYLSTLSPLKKMFSPNTISADYTPSTLLPAEVTVSLYQLSNMYLMFALIERFVLSSSSSRATWRAVLGSFLVADLGHLATMYPLGTGVYWRAWEWNAMGWGSVGVVYLGAAMRTAYLLGVRLDGHVGHRGGKVVTTPLGRKKGE